jgi:Tol biopolymer transport system component
MSETGYIEPVTRAVAADSDPVWSSDGRRLVFRSLQDGPPRLYVHAAHDQDAEDAIVPKSMMDETPTEWRDNRIVVHGPGAKGDLDLFTVDDRTGARLAIANTGFNESDARLSPDRRWLAFVSDESGQPDIYATPWPRGARVRVSFAGGTRPRWGRDGRTLLFVRDTEIMRADLSSSGFTTPRAVLDVRGIRDFDAAHRRDAVLALIPTPSPAPAISSAVVDWQSLVN